MDFTPVVIRDEDEAGSVWRLDKLQDFEQRAKSLGLFNDPAIAELIGTIRSSTADLEGLKERQQQPDYERRWWQDGEYDSGRADEANDRGLALFAAKEYGEAFSCFTEAIRLGPSSPVYHCNRAAAALRLNRDDLAAEDAENALERDENYLRAALRAGQARLKLQDPLKAQQHFQSALAIDAACAAAKSGLAKATALEQQLNDEERAQEEIADAGVRPALSRSFLSAENAALELIAAEQALASLPRLDSAKYSRVEALIACGRFPDALAACSELRPGVEKLHLEAETLWRCGELETALKSLENAFDRAAPSPSQKCVDLKSVLSPIHDAVQDIQRCMEEGLYLDAMESCTLVLKQLDSGACCGLYRLLLRLRGDAAASRQQWEAALADFNMAVQLDSSDSEALRRRADLHKRAGRYLDYFLDVQRLKKIVPDAPGLVGLLQDAARLCEHGGGGEGGAEGCSTGPASAYAQLGVRQNAPLTEVRKAYLRLAGGWHPDKWATAADDEKTTAEERFKRIQAAYEALTA